MRFFSALLLAAFLAMTGAPSVLAISVSPATIDLRGTRGETLQSSVTLINTEGKEKTHYLSVVKFEGRDDGAAPKFLPDDKAGFPGWVTLPSARVLVPAHAKVEVPFQVLIPSDVPSGSYFAAIMVSDAPHEIVATNGASIQANIAVLLFLTVEGETTAKSALLDFKIFPTGVLDVPAGQYQIRLQNQGNVYVVPNGTITLRDVFGRVVSQTAVNQDLARLLPGTTRTFSGSFGNAGEGNFFAKAVAQAKQFSIGPVKAELHLQAGNTMDASVAATVFPWQLLVAVIGAVAVLLLLTRALANRKRVV